MAKPYLSIQGITKSFDNKIALDHISLDVYKHEIIGLIGHSGSGKSTLLRQIYGLDDLDSGRIELQGERVKGRSEVLVAGDDRVKYVRQNYDLYPDHTVFENIEHQIRFLRKEDIQIKIDKISKAFNIQDILHLKAKTISGGEQQRVAICCALVDTPQLLLLDEPLAHLDQINSRLIKEYLWRFVKKEKITTIFVTHSPEDALAYSTRIGIIGNGKLIEEGTPQKLYTAPAHLYTGELLGSCNRIKPTLIPEPYKTPKQGSYYIRPEHISIDPKGELKALVKESIYLGHVTQLTVQSPIGKLNVYSSQGDLIEKGQSINITINFEHLIFIPKRGATANIE